MRFPFLRRKPCYAEGCDELIAKNHLFCNGHSRMVNHHTRVQVYAALDGMRFRGDGPANYLAAIRKARAEVKQQEALARAMQKKA